MEVETVALSGFDHTDAFCSNADQDFDSLPCDRHFPPDEVAPEAAQAFSEQSQCTVVLPSEANPSVAPLPADHRTGTFAEDLSLMNCGKTAIEENKDVEARAEVPHPSTKELGVTSVSRKEGIAIDLAVGGLSVVDRSEYKAATKVQKVYRSYRTRRRLADSAIVAEELWWQARDFARLNYSTVSFFNYTKPETAISRWNRVTINASKVGQGLSKDGKALKLAFQHWIEAIDPRHRYGHNLHFYYDKWCESKAGQPFFYWLDIGEGKNVELEECPRSLLRQQCIKYLGPKKKGVFQHSSFLAGGSTLAAGRFIAENGVLKAIWAYSGHYKPTDDNLKQFLNHLSENGVDLNEVQIRSSDNEDYYDHDIKQLQAQIGKMVDDVVPVSKPPPLQILTSKFVPPSEPLIEISINTGSKVEGKAYRRTLSGGLHSPMAQVSEKDILERIKSKKESSSYQLGQQVSSKWCSGAGPRIGCVADYPVELRLQALEFTKLSPRRFPTPRSSQPSSFLPSSPSVIPQFSS